MLEHDAALLRGRDPRGRRTRDGLGLLHERFDALRRGQRRLQDGVLVGQFTERQKEHSGILHEADQSPQGDRAMQHLTATRPQDHGDGYGADRVHRGEKTGLIHVGLHLDVAAAYVEHVEFRPARSLVREQLHYGHAGQRFRQIRVDRRKPFANLPVYDARPYAIQVDEEQQRRNRDQRPQRHPRTLEPHDRDDA